MPRKEVSEIVARLAGIDAKLDGLAEMLRKHDAHLVGHDERLRAVEKHMNIAFGWAAAVGFCLSIVWTWVSSKIFGHP